MSSGLARLEEFSAQDYNDVSMGEKPKGPVFNVVVKVEIPEALSEMAPYLQGFIQGMVAKLYDNKHKTPPRQCDALKFLMLMHREMVELHEQCIEDRSSPNLYNETYDVANYAFLMSMAMSLEKEDALAKALADEDERERTWWRRYAASSNQWLLGTVEFFMKPKKIGE